MITLPRRLASAFHYTFFVSFSHLFVSARIMWLKSLQPISRVINSANICFVLSGSKKAQCVLLSTLFVRWFLRWPPMKKKGGNRSRATTQHGKMARSRELSRIPGVPVREESKKREPRMLSRGSFSINLAFETAFVCLPFFFQERASEWGISATVLSVSGFFFYLFTVAPFSASGTKKAQAKIWLAGPGNFKCAPT